MHPLFAARPDGIVPILNAYALATLVRTLHFDNEVYRRGWLNAFGFSNLSVVRDASGFPCPYAIARSPEGIVLAFDGLYNFEQAIRYFTDCDLCDYYESPGQILVFIREWWAQIRANVIALVNGAPNNQKIVVCGYSAGGALAALVVKVIESVIGAGRVQYGMSFGSPKAGDGDFVAGVTRPFYAIENEGDYVPAFPLWTARYQGDNWLPTGTALPARVGQCLYLYRTGAITFDATTYLRGPATPNLFLRQLFAGETGLGADHQIGEYVRRLEKNIASGNFQFADQLKLLNQAMDLGVSVVDFVTPVTPDAATPNASPNLPTLERVASIPSNDGDPTNPTPATWDNKLAGSLIRTRAKVQVSDAIVDRAWLELHGSDRRMVDQLLTTLARIDRRDGRLVNSSRFRSMRSPKKLVRRALNLFARIAARDAKAANPKKTDALSTRAFIFDPDNEVITFSVDQVVSALQARLAISDRKRPILRRDDSQLIACKENVTTELTVWFLDDALVSF